MAREMTPQERAAAALLDRIVGIIPMQPFQREARIEWLVEYAQETRRAALLEAAKLVGDYNCMHNHGKGAPKVYDDVFDELHRRAQEG